MNIEERWPKFKEEPHNLNLPLVVDDVNLFAQLRYTFSMCPIFVINNNIPPWMSTKREHIMLTMIVPGIILFTIYIFVNKITSHLSCFFYNYLLYFFVYSYMFNDVLYLFFTHICSNYVLCVQ